MQSAAGTAVGDRASKSGAIRTKGIIGRTLSVVRPSTTTLSPAGIVDFVPLEELVQQAFASELSATLAARASDYEWRRASAPSGTGFAERIRREDVVNWLGVARGQCGSVRARGWNV